MKAKVLYVLLNKAADDRAFLHSLLGMSYYRDYL